jgi:hypothetical protein
VLLEYDGTPECHGIVDTAGMAEAIVHDEEGIRKNDELVTGQIPMTYNSKSIKTYLAVQ